MTRVLEISIEGNAINSLELPFYNRLRRFGLPTNVEPGTYDFQKKEIKITDISDRPDIVEAQKVLLLSGAEASSINSIKVKYTNTDILLITALKDDLPELYEEMRKSLLEEFQTLYTAKSRIENAGTAQQLINLQQ